MRDLLERCWRLVAADRWQAATLTLDLALLAALDLAQVVCLHRIIVDLDRSALAPAAGLIAVALLSGAWDRRLRARTSEVFADFVDGYTAEVLRRLGALDLLAFEALDREALRLALQNELEQLRRFGHAFADIMKGAVTATLCLGYVLFVAPGAGLLVVGWMAGLVLLIALRGGPLGRRQRARSASRAAFARAAQTLVAGARELGLHRARSEAVGGEVARRGEAHRQAERALDVEVSRSEAQVYLGAPGLIGLAAFAVPLLVVDGWAVAPGLLAVALFSLRYVLQLGRAGTAAIRMAPVLEELDGLLSALGAARRAPVDEADEAPLAPGVVSLRGVRFAYPARGGAPGFDLGPIDLELHPGRVHFIVGANGSGKSTLLKVLTGLYPPAGGVVQVDGQPVSTTGAAYRALFSVAFAEPVVHRLPYGLDPDPARVEALIARFGLTGAVRFVDGAFDTVDLSTGQRKRLSLILCLLQDRPVLVLDEWAADQDPGFRAWFYETLLPELRAEGRTLAVISHDDGYFAAADETLTLARGEARR